MLDINFGTVTSFSLQKPEGEVETLCTTFLKSLGSKDPQIIFRKLWERKYDHCLPPRSLLVAVGELRFSQGIAHCGVRLSLRGKQEQWAVGCCMEFRV